MVLAWTLSAGSVQAAEERFVDRGRLSSTQWEQLLHSASKVSEAGQRIAILSSAFLDTPYREYSLIGSPDQNEVLVMDLGTVDCFTLLDYVESLRRSTLFSEVLAHLQQVRYHEGLVTYRTRNHFFSDWKHQNSPRIEDVTGNLGRGRTLTVAKRLNLKDDGSLWLPGVPVANREIEYLPTRAIDQKTIDALRTGDYVGIYSEHSGLDVSHTGIVIKTDERTFLRHASSKKESRRVIDSDLSEYLQGTPGIIVYRPR